MSDSGSGILQALLSPTDGSNFLKDFWPDNLCVVHGPLQRLPAPFSNLELSSYRELFARYKGRVLFGKGSQGPRSFQMEQIDPLHLFEMDLSLYLPDIEPVVSGASAFLRQLEESLGLNQGEARMTAWASPSADGIACHFDAEEVFSIQLQGTKRFYVAHEKALASPVGLQFAPGIRPAPELYLQMPDGFPNPDDFEFTEIEMTPGSVLFVPRGVWHRTEADQDSLSISVVLSPISAADRLLNELRSLLLQDAGWRRPLYQTANSGGRNGSVEEPIASLLKSLPDLVATIRAADLRPHQENASLENIQPNMRFQKIPGASLIVDSDVELPALRVNIGSNDSAALYQQWQALTIPPHYLGVVDVLQHLEAAFSLQDLMSRFVDIPLNEHQAVFAFLVQSSFLQLLWFRQLEPKTQKARAIPQR